MTKELVIEIASDVICPWCYIGKRRMEKALALLDGKVKPDIRWLPFELNPEMPAAGMPRAAYREAKFGSVERGRELDARVAAEGRGEGIAVAFERIERQAVDRDRRALGDLERRQLLGAERLRRRAERLHEVDRDDDLAGARAVHQAVGDADAVAEGDELLGADRAGHAEHRFAQVQ